MSVTKAMVSTKNEEVPYEELQEQLLEQMKLGYREPFRRRVSEIFESRFLSVDERAGLDELSRGEFIQARTEALIAEMADRTWERLTTGKRPSAEVLLRQLSTDPGYQRDVIRDILRQSVWEIEQELEGDSSEVSPERELVA